MKKKHFPRRELFLSVPGHGVERLALDIWWLMFEIDSGEWEREREREGEGGGGREKEREKWSVFWLQLNAAQETDALDKIKTPEKTYLFFYLCILL